VKRIRVPGKRGPVELYALLFATNTIIPQAILPMLPTFTFEVVPEEPKQMKNQGLKPRPVHKGRLVRHKSFGVLPPAAGESPPQEDLSTKEATT
jgi:hypothetical protein